MEDYLRQFLEYLEIERGYSPRTLTAYAAFLHRFLAWLKEHHCQINNPEDLTEEIVREYRLHLAHSPGRRDDLLKKATQAYHVIALRTFLRFLMVQKHMEVISPELVELPKLGQRTVNFLLLEQVEQLLEGPDTATLIGLRDRAILEMLFSTGLRVSELVSLNRDQVNRKRKEFGVLGKGGKARLVFLSDNAAFWLSQYLSQRKDSLRPLFISHNERGRKSRESRLTLFSVERIVKRYGRRAQLPFDVTPHTLRHSFATDLMIAGADIRAVQELLGHSSIRTTQIYTHVTDRQLRDVFRTFHRHSRSS